MTTRYTIEACYHATTVRMGFDTKESAEAAYQKLCRALESYRQFKNDRIETVEVEAMAGPSTFRLERLDAVLLNNHDNWEEDLRECLQKEKLARSIREELGLPELPSKLR